MYHTVRFDKADLCVPFCAQLNKASFHFTLLLLLAIILLLPLLRLPPRRNVFLTDVASHTIGLHRTWPHGLARMALVLFESAFEVHRHEGFQSEVVCLVR
ncbi:hypothetical protein KC316_g83 [Hortaea werneckii]|nr:hypothetical protein KC316_g83 [Hortaea werneckii]